jgi:Mg2+ and Co2+ transporter CorA
MACCTKIRHCACPTISKQLLFPIWAEELMMQGLYLSDIQDHLITMTQNLNHYEKILSRSHSNYLAQISIEMTDANNQINDVLSKLTALGTVLM